MDFRAIYAQKTPDELLRLAADKGSLTPEAQGALQAELSKRGMAAGAAAGGAPQPAGAPAETQPFRPFSAKLKSALMVLALFAVLVGGWSLARFAADSWEIPKGTVFVFALALYLLVRWWFSRSDSKGGS